MWRVTLNSMRALAVMLVCQAAAWAQCAMCRTAAAAQGPEATSALNLAILILFLPAVGMFCGVYILSFRYKNSAAEDEAEDDRW